MRTDERFRLLLLRQERKEEEDSMLFYDYDEISAMVENDEITAEESGFMQGYMEADEI